MTPPPDSAPDESVPTLSPDLAYKRDVLRRRLGTELGDRTFRAWLERSLAAVTPAPEEEPAAEPQAEPVVCRTPAADKPAVAEPAATNSAGNGCGGRASIPPAHPVAAGSIPAPRTERTGPAIAAVIERGDRRGRPWSEEEKQAVRERYIAGDAVVDIAAALGRERNSTRQMISRMGVRRPGPHRTWSEEEKQAVRERYIAGDAVVDIAAALGRTQSATLYAISKMGLWGHPDRPCRRARRGGASRRRAPDPEREALADQIVEASARHAAEPDTGPDTGPEDDDETALISASSNEGPEISALEPAPAPLRGCLWIEGDERAPTWCGAPRSPGRPYCIDRCVRAYVTSSGRRFPRSRFERPPEPMAFRARSTA